MQRLNRYTFNTFCMTNLFLLALTMLLFQSCNSTENKFDASGTFETDEVIVSTELNGQLLSFKVNEGDVLTKGQVVGKIDSVSLLYQKQQVEATIRSLSEKTSDV